MNFKSIVFIFAVNYTIGYLKIFKSNVLYWLALLVKFMVSWIFESQIHDLHGSPYFSFLSLEICVAGVEWPVRLCGRTRSVTLLSLCRFGGLCIFIQWSLEFFSSFPPFLPLRKCTSEGRMKLSCLSILCAHRLIVAPVFSKILLRYSFVILILGFEN